MENNELIEVMSQALKTVENLQSALSKMKPLADFGAAVIDDGRYYSFNDAAKSLYESVKKETGFSIGEKKLFNALRELDILSSHGSNWNQPRQEHITAGRFVVVKHQTDVGIKSVTKITGKGLAYILPKLLEYYR
jgi:phage antirepressor YoqD-like protein